MRLCVGCFYRWGLWVRKLVQPRLRCEHGGAEHGAVQQWAELWGMLRAQVCQRPRMVPFRESLHLNHRHQLLPTELRSSQRQWWLVQPSSPPLRPRHAYVPQDRRVPRRHRPSLFPPVSFFSTTFPICPSDYRHSPLTHF